jgi:bifunctional DNase/RNase
MRRRRRHRAATGGFGTTMRELTIEAVRVSLMNYNRVVVLKEKDADRYLPIWIGQSEADAIAMKQKGVSFSAP